MQFNKSYRLLRFLNRRHSALVRYSLGIIAWICTAIITRSRRLSNAMFTEFVIDDFRLAFRRAGWFARHVWPKLDFFNDPFFDFTMDTTPHQRRQLKRFVDRSRRSMSLPVYLTDLLYIQAADIHGELERNPGGYNPATAVKAFYDTADCVLKDLSISQAPVAPEEDQRQDDFSKSDATRALQDFARALPLDEWPWYVISGTFLGLHRDGGFLPHDYDIDVGINAEDISIGSLIDVLENQSEFVVKKVDEHIEVTQDADGYMILSRVPALVKLVHSNGLNLDVFIHHTENGSCWHGSIIHRWENEPFALERRCLEGIEVNAPVEADRYLTENYGDWKTPVKDFDCTTGTPNLVVSRNFLSIALFLKRLAVFCETDRHQAEKLRRTLIASGVIQDDQQSMKVIRSFEFTVGLEGVA